MNDNLKILQGKLKNIAKIKRDLEYSINKMQVPLSKIQAEDIDGLTEAERETISAFNSRFASYQEQIGKAMKSIAIEEENDSERFTVILALMEKIGIIDDLPKWGDVRELRNSVNHVYEDDAKELFKIFDNMIKSVPYLYNIHTNMHAFVQDEYIDPLRITEEMDDIPPHK